MFLFMGINCSPWHGWPWSHWPSLVGGGVSNSSWWSQSLFYCFFFPPIFHLMQLLSLFCCFLQISQSGRWCPCVFLRKSTHTFSEMKLSQTKVKIWIWERPSIEKLLWLSSCCVFCGIVNILKPTFSIAWAPIATPSFPCVSSCLALLTRVSIYTHISANFSDDITGYIPMSFMENELRFCTNVLGSMVWFFRRTCCTRFLQ